MRSKPSTRASEVDPENRLHSHANGRRLDAEAIRDAMLRVSGELDSTMYGNTVRANSESARRSIYVACRRNSLDQFLSVFDAPMPFATKGRRDVTNVPAQSLTLLNDPFVLKLAEQWSSHVLSDDQDSEKRISDMFESALGRLPTDGEAEALSTYVAQLAKDLQSREATRTALTSELERSQLELDSLLQPSRKELEQRSDAITDVATANPIAQWDFQSGYRDSVGSLHGRPHGPATIENGSLVLGKGAYVATQPLGRDLGTKTMTAWVRLDSLEQRGGAVISIQDLQGNVFDAVVYGEQAERRWLAGSDGFARTEPFNGSAETEAHQRAVHIALVYEDDGTIRAYRDGVRYGQPIRRSDPVHFKSGQAQVLFGLRHGSPEPSRLLRGAIMEAKLFDRALTAVEISAEAGATIISDEQVLANLSTGDRDRVIDLRHRVLMIEKERDALGPAMQPGVAWTRLAHLIFNLKEFIYLN